MSIWSKGGTCFKAHHTFGTYSSNFGGVFHSEKNLSLNLKVLDKNLEGSTLQWHGELLNYNTSSTCGATFVIYSIQTMCDVFLWAFFRPSLTHHINAFCGNSWKVSTRNCGSSLVCANEKMKKSPSCLGNIGDYTTQLYEDYNKPLSGSPVHNQHNGK